MTITCLSQVALHYNAGGSDKLYIIQVQEETTAAGTKYKTVGYFGRRGGSLKTAQKYDGTSLAAANAQSNSKEKEQRGKGYEDFTHPIPGMPSDAPTFGGPAVASAAAAVAAAVPPKKASVGPLPMLAEVADEARAEVLMSDPDWVGQKKYDGERVTVSIRRNAIQAYNRKGEERALSGPAEASLKRLVARTDFSDDRETVLDGELMGDVYVAYDVLVLRDNDIRKTSYEERYYQLEALLEDNLGLLAETAWTEEAKRAMYARALKEGWEGMMFRNVEGNYVTGRTSLLLKFKLWATATCRVLTVNSKRSVQLALRDEHDNEQFCGNVTVPVNQDIPTGDDLVEVRYLYAMEGGSLYQPVLIRVRTDIDEADLRSTLRQAPPEKREPLAAAA